MKLITIFELATKSESELRVLYLAVFNVPARGDRENLEHQNAPGLAGKYPPRNDFKSVAPLSRHTERP
ncbi:hypothetical protein D3C85_1372620 [compost metagenome]